jgi:hypothetical protein
MSYAYFLFYSLFNFYSMYQNKVIFNQLKNNGYGMSYVSVRLPPHVRLGVSRHFPAKILGPKLKSTTQNQRRNHGMMAHLRRPILHQ